MGAQPNPGNPPTPASNFSHPFLSGPIPWQEKLKAMSKFCQGQRPMSLYPCSQFLIKPQVLAGAREPGLMLSQGQELPSLKARGQSTLPSGRCRLSNKPSHQAPAVLSCGEGKSVHCHESWAFMKYPVLGWTSMGRWKLPGRRTWPGMAGALPGA